MPSKLRKAIGAVKDQTSISLAKVSNNNAANLEVAILKATTHDHVPIEERYVLEILHLISSNKVYAAACAQAIGKRIGKTRNWIVALKSLMIVLRVFQDGDPYFPREILHAMKRGAKILNLASFRDDSNSNPWDYTAFVRTFALYLDERLDCFLTGKLQRRFTNRDRGVNRRGRRPFEPVRDMKPAMLLDKLSYWQRLLDRAMATRPTGAARSNRLVQISLYAVVQESFDLYRDLSDGLGLILDSFFHLQYQSCVFAFQICVKASKQFEELGRFYDLCKSLGVGRTSEYPSVQKVSEELVETLQEFLKDQASFPIHGKPPAPRLALPSPDQGPNPDQFDTYSYSSEPTERIDRSSEFGSRRTSLEDLMSIDHGTNPGSYTIDRFSEQLERQSSQMETMSLPDSINISVSEKLGVDSTNCLISFDDWPDEDPKQEQEPSSAPVSINNADCWELVLSESTNQPAQMQTQASTNNMNGFPTSIMDNLFDQPLTTNYQPPTTTYQHQYNPFLDDMSDFSVNTMPFSDQNALALATTPPNNQQALALIPTTPPSNQQALALTYHDDNLFLAAPTFQAIKPTFCETITPLNDQQALALTIPDDNLFLAASTFQATKPTFSDIAMPQNNQQAQALITATPPSNQQALALTSPCDNLFLAAPTYEATKSTFSEIATPRNNQQAQALIPTMPASCQQALALTVPDDNLFLAGPTFTETVTSFNNQNALALITTTPPSNQQALALTYPEDNLFLATPTFQATKPTFSESATPCNDQLALALTFPDDNLFSAAPTFQASTKPTFTAQSSNEFRFQDQDDLFGPCPVVASSTNFVANGFQQQNVLHEQQIWLENQNRIISKHLS
ncbi:hypothetical protein ACFE04_030350 [Oxalis oulophora]